MLPISVCKVPVNIISIIMWHVSINSTSNNYYFVHMLTCNVGHQFSCKTKKISAECCRQKVEKPLLVLYSNSGLKRNYSLGLSVEESYS